MMTADQYREAIAALGLSQVGAARVFGIGDRTSRRFAVGEDIPWSIEMLLNVMVAKGISPDELRNIADHHRLPRAVTILLYLMSADRVTPREALAIGLDSRNGSICDAPGHGSLGHDHELTPAAFPQAERNLHAQRFAIANRFGRHHATLRTLTASGRTRSSSTSLVRPAVQTLSLSGCTSPRRVRRGAGRCA